MKTDTVAAYLVVVLLIASGCDQLERKRTQFATTDNSSFLSLSMKSSERPDEGFQLMGFNSNELQTCRVIHPDNVGDITVDTIEMTFARPKTDPNQLTETSILYFPYVPQEDKKVTEGDLALYLKRNRGPLTISYFDSWNNGQDRSQCLVTYQTVQGQLTGTFGCPTMSFDGGETLDVRASFSCVLK